MKTRIEIKEIAKETVKQNYGAALLPSLIYMLLSAAAGSIVPGIGALLLLPLSVGANLMYLLLWKNERPSLDIMFTSAFQENYGRKLGGMLLVTLYTWLWSLLLVVPGIVKHYSYAATSYILAKYPSVGAESAINISKRVMNGHKLDLFVMELSFIGWELLGIITFGLLNIFWVTPYQSVATAGCFDEYLYDAITCGRVNPAELGQY